MLRSTPFIFFLASPRMSTYLTLPCVSFTFLAGAAVEHYFTVTKDRQTDFFPLFFVLFPSPHSSFFT